MGYMYIGPLGDGSQALGYSVGVVSQLDSMTIPNRSWGARRNWRERCRRFAWAAQAVAERKWLEQQAREAAFEGAAEEYMFERHYY